MSYPTAYAYLVTGEWSLLLGPVQMIIGFATGAVLVHATGKLILGGRPGVVDTVSEVLDDAGRLVGLGLRVTLAFIGLMITLVGIPFAIRVFIRWSFGVQAVLFRDQDSDGAISHSCRLVDGRWWYVAALMFVPFFVFGPTLVGSFLWPSPGFSILQSVLGILAAPLLSGFITSVFFRLERQSGLSETPAPSATLEA